MATTIYEVAEKSGVSIGTVSRVLNDSPLTAVATREKVLQVMNELDYQPDAMAQGLARRKTNAIGVVTPLFNGHSHTEVLCGIQRALAQHNLDLILYGIDDLQRKDVLLRRALQQRRVDGLLLVSMALSGALAVDCKRRRLPLVLGDGSHHQFDSITVDNEAGAALAAEYVMRLGYRHFALLAGDYENIPAQSRLHDCQHALQEAGAAFSGLTIIRSEAHDKKAAEMNGVANWQAGHAAMKSFLAQHFSHNEARSRSLAVFVPCDFQMPGAIKAVQDAGLRIPDEVAIIGFDDTELAEHAGAIIVQQPRAEIGYQAVKRMLALLKNPASSPQQISLKPKLLIQENHRQA